MKDLEVRQRSVYAVSRQRSSASSAHRVCAELLRLLGTLAWLRLTLISRLAKSPILEYRGIRLYMNFLCHGTSSACSESMSACFRGFTRQDSFARALTFMAWRVSSHKLAQLLREMVVRNMRSPKQVATGYTTSRSAWSGYRSRHDLAHFTYLYLSKVPVSTRNWPFPILLESGLVKLTVLLYLGMNMWKYLTIVTRKV